MAHDSPRVQKSARDGKIGTRRALHIVNDISIFPIWATQIVPVLRFRRQPGY